MRSRGLVVALALLLAVGATVAVFLYVNGVRKDALGGGGASQVIVASQDIPANTDLNPLIDQGGVFVQKTIPQDALVADAVTSLDQLRDQTTTVPILANEQIPLSRLSGGTATNVLGICDTCVALSLRVDGPPAVAGHIQRGDNVTLYATFESLTTFRSAKDLVTQIQKTTVATLAGKAVPGGSNNVLTGLPAFTMTVAPTVKVLAVENPAVDTQGRTSNGNVTLTLDVPATAAQFYVFAASKGALYFGLLPPKATGIQLPAEAVNINNILGKKS